MLFRFAIDLFDHISYFHIWQHLIFIRIVVNRQITIKLNLTTIGRKLNTILRKLNSHSIKNRTSHLTRYKSIPDECIEFKLVFIQILSNFFWCIENTRRTNGFVSILSTRSIFYPAAMLRIVTTKAFIDVACSFILSYRTNTSRIGTHIGNQTLNTCTNIDSFIELLGNHHGFTSTEVNLVSRIHLHRGSGIRKRSVSLAFFLINMIHHKVFTG